MFIAKMKELAASGKLSLVIRVVFVTVVLAASAIFGADALAFVGPMPGGVGG